MRSLRRSSASVALAAGVLMLAAAQESRAGGQGTGLPVPDFIDSFDPSFIFDAMNTSQVGAPAPRWVRQAEPATPCTDPQLAVGSSGRLTVLDGIGSTDVCIPDFVSGATLAGKVRATSRVSSVDFEGDPNDPFDDFVEQTVELTLTLSVVLPQGGEVQVQSLVVPPKTFRRNTTDGRFLSSPPLVQEVGWFDGRPLCSGGLILDPNSEQTISVERVAAGSSQGGS